MANFIYIDVDKRLLVFCLFLLNNVDVCGNRASQHAKIMITKSADSKDTTAEINELQPHLKEMLDYTEGVTNMETGGGTFFLKLSLRNGTLLL